MLAISTSKANLSMLRKRNTWYTVTDGNWSNPNVWISNGKRKNILPQPGDDVFIDHNLSVDVTATTGNLYVAGSLTGGTNGITLTINGDLQATGPLNFTGSNINIVLNGYNNIVNTFTAGNTTVKYNRAGDQNVLPFLYKNLVIYNTGIKYLTGNTTILGNLNINDFLPQDAVLECATYDLVVYGNTSMTGCGSSSYTFSKNGSGNILFVGSLNINSNTMFNSSISNLELRSGITGGAFGGKININCPVKFSTNSQTISATGIYFNNSIIISGAIEIVNTSTLIYLNNIINGDNANSTLTNNGYLGLGSSVVPMSIGVFNYMNTSNSTIDYSFDGNYTLPYLTYNNLKIHGTGVKTLSGDTTVLNLTINDFQNSKAKLDCSSYDLIIGGSTIISGTGSGDTLDAGLIKSGAGLITFIGPATWNTSNIGYSSNVNLEFRNGCNFGPFGIETGTVNATLNFTTNTQSLTGSGQTINGPINISNGITLSVTGNGHIFNGLINGTSNTDTLKITGVMYYNNPSPPMAIGSMDTSSVANTFYYSNTSINQDLRPGVYKNLSLGSNIFGGGGTKRLLGNISVLNNYTIVSPTNLNINGYTLTNP